MIHYMLFWVHIFILPISRDRELKKIPRLLTVGTNWTLFHLLVWKQQHKLHKPTVIWGAAGLLEPLWKKKKKSRSRKQLFCTKLSKSEILVKMRPECKGIVSMIPERIWRINWKDWEKKPAQGLLHWHSKQISEWHFIKHFPYQRMPAPVPAQSEERSSQQKKCWGHKEEIFLQLLRNKMQ